MRNIIYTLLIGIILLPACVEEDHLDSVSSGNGFGDFSFRLVPEEYEGLPAESLQKGHRPQQAFATTERQTLSNYDRVEFVVVDDDGYKVNGVKGLYDKNTSDMQLEGLHEGSYRILILGIRGDLTDDNATINPINHISEVWLSFPEELARPLACEYFYSITPFTVRKVSTALGNEVVAEIAEKIVQRRIVGRMDLIFSYNNPYVETAVTSNTIAFNASSRFYTRLSGEGTFSGESNGEMKVLDMAEYTEYLFMPTIEGSSVQGEVTLFTRDYRGNMTKRYYTFDLDSVVENHIGRVEINVVHPDDEIGTMFITNRAYTQGQHGLILQDDEPHTIYTDKELRNFNTTRPLQLSVTSEGQLHARFYSPRSLSHVLVKARIPAAGNEYVDFAYFDSIPPFADFYEAIPLLQKELYFRSESGKIVRIPRMQADDFAGIEFKIESDDPYLEKLKGIIHGWNIRFHLYDGDPTKPNGGPVGNWMGIRPVHCREAVAFFLNFTYMIDMPEHEEILRANEDRLYGNGGVNDKVTPDVVLRQMRQERTLNVGLVYPGNGVIGLGGGSSYGVWQTGWLSHYTNTYACEIMFHELGHVMGYNHSSAFTYGPWAQELMNHFYVNHLDDMPINSSSYLNSSKNPNLY